MAPRASARPKSTNYGSRRDPGRVRLRVTEILAALFLSLALSSTVTWPLASNPGAGAHDDTGTFFDTWLMAWNHEAVTNLRNPLHPPVFEGQPDGASPDDLLLTQSLAAMPLRFAGFGPLAAHNLVLVLSLAFAGFAAFLLARQMRTETAGALFTAGAFVCLPFFQSHLGHIQILSAGLTVLAIRQTLRISSGHGGAAWLGILAALQGMASFDYLLFLDMALLLSMPWALRSGGRKALLRITLWTLAGNAACLPFLTGHFANAAGFPAETTASADISALVSPAVNSMLLGNFRPPATPGGIAFWPGLAVVLGSLSWLLRRDRKDRMAGGWFIAALSAVFLAVSLGPDLVAFGRQIAPGPWRLLAGLPGFSSIRLPSGAAFLFLLPATLAAGRAFSKKPILAGAGILLCLAEVWPGPMPLVDARPERFHGWLAARRFACVAILPVGTGIDSPAYECGNLLGQTIHFTPMVNGYGTSLPEGYRETAEILDTWPSPAADSLLDEIGVECLICRGFIPQEADPVWTGGSEPVSAVVLGRRAAAGD